MNNIPELITQALSSVRHCAVLGLSAVEASRQHVVLKLPYDARLVGNPETGIIHGGALTALMDTACGLAVQMALERREVCPTLDLRIDYMTAAQPHQPVFGRAEVYRFTDNVAFARGVAYQGDDQHIIAHCVATFMRMPHEPVPEGFDLHAQL